MANFNPLFSLLSLAKEMAEKASIATISPAHTMYSLLPPYPNRFAVGPENKSKTTKKKKEVTNSVINDVENTRSGDLCFAANLKYPVSIPYVIITINTAIYA
jgi:hypothetical protein